MKALKFKQGFQSQHWVGDGFPVRNIFSYHDLAPQLSPFLFLDYAGPAEFHPADKVRGVEQHPHRGFETVTIVYSGEVDHRDSAGGGGKIGPGDVQWMTAGRGVVHEEMHGEEFSQRGGFFEMIQLWVNLPAKFKMTEPRYQGIKAAVIPQVNLPEAAGSLRVIAGEAMGLQGPAQTFSPVQIWDVRLNHGHGVKLNMPPGLTCAVFVLSGKIILAGGEEVGEAEIAVLDSEQEEFLLKADADCKLLVLGGEPLNEPIAGHGPFVMNSMEEIKEAFRDFQEGKMGKVGEIKGSEI